MWEANTSADHWFATSNSRHTYFPVTESFTHFGPSWISNYIAQAELPRGCLYPWVKPPTLLPKRSKEVACSFLLVQEMQYHLRNKIVPRHFGRELEKSSCKELYMKCLGKTVTPFIKLINFPNLFQKNLLARDTTKEIIKAECSNFHIWREKWKELFYEIRS